MKRLKLCSLVFLPFVLLGIFLMYTGNSHAAAAKALPATQCGSWQIVPSPNTNGPLNYLLAVSALSNKDAWAVGYNEFSNGNLHTLTEHWNGTGWSIIVSPSPAHRVSILTAVSVDASNDAWAVGFVRFQHGGGDEALVEHWNGSAWSVITIPSATNYLPDTVAAVSPNDVWIAGGIAQAQVEHWDGSTWTIVQDATPSAFVSHVVSMTVISSDDIWAVGNYSPQNSRDNLAYTEHWNGTKWTLVRVLNSKDGNNTAIAISADASNDVWFTGFFDSYKTNVTSMIVEHWNGSAWAYVPIPNASTIIPSGIQALSSNSVWFVGNVGANSSGIIEHWDGTQWSVVVNQTTSVFYGITRVPAKSNLWSVGFVQVGNNRNSLVESYC